MSFSSQPGCSATSNPVRKLNSSVHDTALKSKAYHPKVFQNPLHSTTLAAPNLNYSESSTFQHWKDLSQSPSQHQNFPLFSLTTKNSSSVPNRAWSQEFSAYTNQQNQNSETKWISEFNQQPPSIISNDTIKSRKQKEKTVPVPLSSPQLPMSAAAAHSPLEVAHVNEDELMEKFNHASLEAKSLDKGNLEQTSQAPLTLEQLWTARLADLRTNGLDPKSLEEYQIRWEEFLEEAKIKLPASKQHAFSHTEANQAMETSGTEYENLNKINEQKKEIFSEEQIDSIDYKKLEALPFIEDLYEKAQTLLKNKGPICEAAVLLEKAVLQNPSHLESWQSLAYVHTLLGNESRVIESLLNIKMLDSNQINIIMDLAVAYVNKGSRENALACLRDWLYASHPEYSNRFSSIERKFESLNVLDNTKAIQACFLDLICLSSSSKKFYDKAQTGLGITMYLLEDFSKAADCFRQAVQRNPENCVLWNKLGASLTNSKQEGKAIQAYKRSLELQPQYVRTRSNFSIACINMSCYEEAADHLLHAVDIIQDKHGVFTRCESNLELWDMLRKVLLVGYQSMSLASLAKPGFNTNELRSKLDSYAGEEEYYE
ncbi:peroxisomal targeting signal receptor Pex5 [Schizosaccharomyces cryophilus OY26]|uniref:Peroxisomal targeting signal receptor Pex5 n=1 Tax=Schizosaccharomyces cryophilus (strain OY26 / ATCC MYA-4695 / CBS 11777 / NBRC 106824 / NRRL Y48691) TaxID=653667 RepID=S9VN29_SCHCR|nr:peroxisomal targeting signal receptor Pex5 [Schizosaccharomyces cryophilus OY26]EPY49338.1 peroxisomal targeting signal receptor Pex5 [Schizosaccharomyces cryophilus OY26]